MKVVRIRRGVKDTSDPRPTPDWLADPEHVQPCPCGEDVDPTVILFEGKSGLSRWLHYRCLDWLEHELTEEEIAQKHEWEKRMRKLKEMGDDDDSE
jgi:hypothetical protein